MKFRHGNTEAHKEEGHAKKEAEIGRKQLQTNQNQGFLRALRRLEEAREVPSLEPSKEALLTEEAPSNLQNYERIHFCYFEATRFEVVCYGSSRKQIYTGLFFPIGLKEVCIYISLNK